MSPTWNGRGFSEPDAHELWLLLPESLRHVATQEFAAGNAAEAIQQDLQTSVVLLTFDRPPRLPRPAATNITVHTRHAFGNYCYDGTVCTYELHSPRAFLAFIDPTYDYELDTGLKGAP